MNLAVLVNLLGCFQYTEDALLGQCRSKDDREIHEWSHTIADGILKGINHLLVLLLYQVPLVHYYHQTLVVLLDQLEDIHILGLDTTGCIKHAQCSIISPLRTLIEKTIYSDTDILDIEWHFTNNILSPASWSYNSEELICKYPYELVFQYTDLCAIFKERIISHNTLYIHAIAHPKFRLFNTLMDSCTAITYKQYITKRLLCNNLKKEMDNGYAVLTTTELLESTYNKLVPAISHSPHTYTYANATEIISFQSFDQMLCIFIEEILRYDKYLLCCPTCNKLFLTSSQKIRYCAEHRNQKKNYQANYIRSKVESNSFSSMFNNYKNTLFQRKKRNPELESNYKNWEENASQLLAEFQSTSSPDSQSSIDKFREELNKTVKRAGFKSIRKYRT